MAHGRLVRTALSLLLAACSLSACTGQSLREPGVAVGEFDVSAILKSATCTEAPATWTFKARLRKSGEAYYWDQGTLPVRSTPAPVSPSRKVAIPSERYAFTASSLLVGRPSSPKDPGCEVTRKDELLLSLVKDVDENVVSFDGSLAYGFSPVAGTVCEDADVVNFGVGSVPCQAEYELVARRAAKP
jgi:hypothetical protein